MKIREAAVWFMLVAVLATVLIATVRLGPDRSSRLSTLETRVDLLQSVFLRHMSYLHIADSALIPRVLDSTGTWVPNPLFDPTPFYTAPEAGEEGVTSNGTE